MKGPKFGQYTIGDTIIHNLDSRTKIISCFFNYFFYTVHL